MSDDAWKEVVAEGDATVLYRTPSTEEAQMFLDREDRSGFSLKGWKVFWAEGKRDDVREYAVFDPDGKLKHTSRHIASVMEFIDLVRISSRMGVGGQ